jgi:hypothetical protein
LFKKKSSKNSCKKKVVKKKFFFTTLNILPGNGFPTSCIRPSSYLHIAVIDITESETGFLWFVITNYLTISLQTCSRVTGAVGAERLQHRERSDYSRGSRATGAREAERLEQKEQSDYSRRSGATKVEGAKLLKQEERRD